MNVVSTPQSLIKPSDGAVLVGIDIGGTKTEICLGRYEGDKLTKLRTAVWPSKSWRSHDFASDAGRLLALSSELVGDMSVAAFGIGAHGCDDDQECDAFAAALRALTASPLRVVNDAELMPLAMGQADQIGLVAGTGSIAVCRDENGRMLSAGGWGWLIGDDGSAAGLVREAARAIARALDSGAASDDPLIAHIYGSLGNPPRPRLGSALAQLGGPASIGLHARAVFAAYEQGSVLATRVINEGAAALAELVTDLQIRGSKATHVVAGGSVIASQPPLWRAFAAAVTLRSEGLITPLLFRGHPVDGACQVALEALNTP